MGRGQEPDRDPRWSARAPALLGMAGLAALVLGFGGWATMTRIAGAVVAAGQVEVDRNRQVVQHPDGGVVAAILVKDGDLVAAGQALIEFDGTLLASELAVVEGQFFEILARRGRLEAERDDRPEVSFPAELVETAALRPEIAGQMQGQLRLFEARVESMEKERDQLGRRKAQTQSQIAGVEAQSAAIGTQLALLKEELADQQTLLDRGLAEASRVLALQREQARLAGLAGEQAASRAEAEGRITEIEIEIDKLGSRRREEANAELRDLGYRELELAERRRALKEQFARLSVRAPVAGIVHELQVTTPRAVVRAADPILYLVPQDRPLIVATQIATVHVDEVRLGQEVRLRFTAFDSRTTPELIGRVERISADAIVDERTQAAYYRGDVVIAPAEIARLEGQALIPGMPVQAFFRTGDRTPLAYLLKPLTDYFQRAFREK
jgi:HlyD family secretion protein